MTAREVATQVFPSGCGADVDGVHGVVPHAVHEETVQGGVERARLDPPHPLAAVAWSAGV